MTQRRQGPKVAFLSTASSIGGMERIICGLSREFSARDWHVRTVFPISERREALLAWCRDQGVEAETHPAVLDAAATHSWGGVARLRDFVRAMRPEVVNIHFGDNFISLKDLIALRAAGPRRCIVTVHHPTSWEDTSARKRLMTGLASRLAHEVVTISHASYSILREGGVPPGKLHLIPCGVRPPAHTTERGKARQRLGLPDQATLIGSLARLVPHKGNDDLIRAVARLIEGRDDVNLVIAGDGPERAGLEALANQLLPGRCIFLGRVPDVDEYLASLDIFALPSHLEGFGLVYVEAAYHSVPSVGTNVGGIPDAIIDQETGLLVPVGDVEALATSLRRLCDDPMLRRRLGDAARARAYAELTERIQAERYEQVFRGARPIPPVLKRANV